MDFVTIPDVELVTVGMKWPTSPVPSTLTFEHLADMQTAAMEDPHVTRPRVKLGHTDPRFDDVGAHDPFFDGEPVFGTIDNLRLENDGAVLIGDLTEVPQWLADAAPSSWPTRSCEWNWDVETPGGKKYSAVLTGVALGGVWTPAIKDLEDLERVMTEGPSPAEVAATADPDMPTDPNPQTVTARADVDKVLERFFSDYAIDDRYWWWVRSVWTDPNELIVDDDEGSLFRVPYTSDDQQEVSFDDATPVLQTFVDVASGAEIAAWPRERHAGRPARVFASRAEVVPADRAERGGSGNPVASDQVMDVDGAQLRQALGLEAEASDDEVTQALATRAEAPGSEQEQPTAPPQNPEDPNQTEPPDEQPPAEPPATPPATPPAEPPADPGEPAAPEQVAEPVAASDQVVLDRSTWDTVQRQAREGSAAHAELSIERRETLLSDAVEAGKFPPARKDHYRKAHKADPEGTEALIESLEPGLVPVDERGTSKDDVTGEGDMPAIMASFGVQLPGADNG